MMEYTVVKNATKDEAGLSVTSSEGGRTKIVIESPSGKATAVVLETQETALLARAINDAVAPDSDKGSLRTVKAACGHCLAEVELRILISAPFKITLATEKCPSCGKRLVSIMPRGAGKLKAI